MDQRFALIREKVKFTADFLWFVIRDVDCAGQTLTSCINSARIIQDDIQLFQPHFDLFCP